MRGLLNSRVPRVIAWHCTCRRERRPTASIGRPGGLSGVKARDDVLNNLFTLVQTLLSYVLSLTAGVLPIGL
jgi:hypothetical protein